MAEALVIQDTTYAGEAASYFITRPVIEMDTVQKGCIHVHDGIKKQYTIPRIEVSGFMQKRAATPSSKGNINVDGKVLIPRDMMLYLEFNPRDYEQHWQAVNLEPKLLDRELPPTAEDFTVLQTMKRLNEFFENATWKSRIMFDPEGLAVDPTTKGQAATDVQYLYFDGLIVKLLQASETVKVSSPATLVSGTAGGGQENILDAMGRAYKAVPQAILYKYGAKGLKFHISYATQQIYEEALTTQTFKNNDTTEKGINRYKGYDVVPLAGMPDNTIVICVSSPDLDSNPWLGVNSTEDQDGLQLARLQANSELYFIKGLFKMDTQFGFPDFVVLYTTITL
ncbi:hypothetical protein PV783_11600 [Chitinophaga sp. CC14]|uniref:hypothetical protein n=1 Tax=Chitinophaga sp. CC14 TaxID=3029199 RepID=UPI003B7D889E